MKTGICVLAAILAAAQASGQTTSLSSSQSGADQMAVPPPVSAMGLTTVTGSEERSNYLSGAIFFSGGYASNLYPGTGTKPVNDRIYSVQPTFSLDQSTTRIHVTLQYSPTFSFYDPNSSLNTIDQSAMVAFQYRLSPHSALLLNDAAMKTTNTWNQPLSPSTVSGGLPAVTPGFIMPFAPQISNNAAAQWTWQFSRGGMIGAGGTTTLLHFSDASLAQGLYDSTSRGGSGFYTHRIGARQYFGGLYQYSVIQATPILEAGIAEADLTTHNVLGFYTAYLTPTFTLSLGGGYQYYQLAQAPALQLHGWTPTAIGSLGWQGKHTSLALSYSRLVTEGEGIIGAYASDLGQASARWQLSRNWTTSVNATYSNFNAVAGIAGLIQQWHTFSVAASLSRQLGPYLSASAQYERLNQNYAGISAVSTDPNGSLVTGFLSYHFSRPLGR